MQGIEEILEKLAEKRHAHIPLYETFLQPTDDERVHPYLTYDNVLVWRGCARCRSCTPQYAHLAAEAEKTREAIYSHCVKTNADGKAYFAWSVDLNGHSDVYDEPPGSLQLLPHLGFCAADDPAYTATVQMIRSPQYHTASPVAHCRNRLSACAAPLAAQYCQQPDMRPCGALHQHPAPHSDG